MPELSRFYGVVVYMNYRDHNPPHFHARYGEQEVTVELGTSVVDGRTSHRALQLVFEWAELHRDALAENWQRSPEGRVRGCRSRPSFEKRRATDAHISPCHGD